MLIHTNDMQTMMKRKRKQQFISLPRLIYVQLLYKDTNNDDFFPIFSLSATKCNAKKRNLQNYVLVVGQNGLWRSEQIAPSG